MIGLPPVVPGKRELDELGVLERIRDVATAQMKGLACREHSLPLAKRYRPAGTRCRAATISPRSRSCDSNPPTRLTSAFSQPTAASCQGWRPGRILRPMSYVGSYLWRLRQEIGNAPVLMPGAMVALQRDDEQVLLTKRTDDGSWSLPAGAAEIGGSFARTGVEEVLEEAGIRVSEKDLIPFACLSKAETHTIRYPNGDVTHCFALCFLAREWEGEPRPDRDESTEVRFAELGAAPEPVHPPTARALELLTAYLDFGVFQVH